MAALGLPSAPPSAGVGTPPPRPAQGTAPVGNHNHQARQGAYNDLLLRDATTASFGLSQRFEVEGLSFGNLARFVNRYLANFVPYGFEEVRFSSFVINEDVLTSKGRREHMVGPALTVSTGQWYGSGCLRLFTTAPQHRET